MHAAHLFMFQKGELLLALRERADAMVREVEAAAEDDVLQADPNEYVNALIERYKVESPVLKPEDMALQTSTAQVDISKDRSRPIRDRRSPLCVAGHRTVVQIPFVGDGSMFLLQPNKFTLQEHQAKVGDGELFLEFEYPDDRAPDLISEAWKLVAQLRQNLGNAQGDIANHNIELVGKARTRSRVGVIGFTNTALTSPLRGYLSRLGRLNASWLSALTDPYDCGRWWRRQSPPQGLHNLGSSRPGLGGS